jgi:hypothetical protein
MMTTTLELANTEQKLARALGRTGISYRELKAAADEIVLFGSRAAGEARRSSDWDLLCVGPSKTQLNATIDMVWLIPQKVESAAWLGSELAGHVAKYGVWLKGRNLWERHVFRSNLAVERKTVRISEELDALTRAARLSPPYFLKYAALVRRDVQRLACLLKCVPVPPTAVLDRDWPTVPDPAGLACRVLEEANAFSRTTIDRLARLLTDPSMWPHHGPQSCE